MPGGTSAAPGKCTQAHASLGSGVHWPSMDPWPSPMPGGTGAAPGKRRTQAHSHIRLPRE
eukprot:4605470-Prymnesium_polylepis.3